MKLGVQVGLGPGHIVLDGDPATSPQKGGTVPNFRRISIVAIWLDGSRCRWIQMPLGTVVGLGPGRIVLGHPTPKIGTPQKNWPMSVVAKRLDGSRCHLVWR